MKNIQKVSTGSPWEDKVGYSRAVKIGNVIEVSGTTATGEGLTDEYSQTKAIIESVAKVLEGLDASLNDVVRTRVYVTDISKWEAVGKAHGEFFGKIKPAMAMVEVSKLINPEILVEIEFTAIV